MNTMVQKGKENGAAFIPVPKGINPPGKANKTGGGATGGSKVKK